MTRAMPIRAVDMSLDRLAFGALWAGERLLGRAFAARAVRPLKDRVAARVRESTIPGARQELERVEGFSAEVFERDYYRRGRPVVFSGAARGWPCVQRWSPEFFGSRSSSGLIEGGLLSQHPELTAMLGAEFGSALRKLTRAPGAPELVMGSAGANTGLRAAMTNDLFVQVYGQADWTLVHPSQSALCKPVCESRPTFRSELTAAEVARLPGWQASLQPGDILYLPPFYWHSVLSPTFSIGVAHRWLAVVPAVRTSVSMALLALLATHPSPIASLIRPR